MMVYGDPQIECSSLQVLDRLAQLLQKIQINNLDQVRTLLIQIGQFEQAIADLGDKGTIDRVQRATDLITRGFLSIFDGNKSGDVAAKWTTILDFENFRDLSGCRLRIKVPEGFEFYTLFPEQYVAAARKFVSNWQDGNGSAALRSHGSASPEGPGVLVVGVRS